MHTGLKLTRACVEAPKSNPVWISTENRGNQKNEEKKLNDLLISVIVVHYPVHS
ncbi:protein of unknown function [Methylotuvimicrobium alcaliphilum 20Z]|uniref:Uncharacterized protein n=1 Tax=Methylotuvimicrobium alcaliphilum (strain DSM 19304 / NCIMB 14124 / VKM B-2133 / 20Z) TaxID=1091494 RepID=G4SUX2_META2|nr:protein of unknown function [Methylotuvimicrobium alcaliphilum 20Z]